VSRRGGISLPHRGFKATEAQGIGASTVEAEARIMGQQPWGARTSN